MQVNNVKYLVNKFNLRAVYSLKASEICQIMLVDQQHHEQNKRVGEEVTEKIKIKFSHEEICQALCISLFNQSERLWHTCEKIK